ncbi:4-amino-4-deoxy-L-arabinose transferase-like glycosyltransferase [Luteibacter sp. Sphag1AF]|uniref:glycosyltransferase family 39 protein n=1 Tax=Luteibacter sp. Sphag1AF TaxID=2587031 RepID=UPI00184CE89A|nr:glycosyltransferase family 39 protein [Luteibacter sp. Sphag1AF]MBB3226853.1 4-amino-4-deoxy-L-arabinose transferase-like glycosyltransferase [Luteibacter sp. Sphag1AF]
MTFRHRASVAAPVAVWRAVFVVLFVAVFVAKIAIACFLSPFGDEAFYWQESLRPAWGYSDLPPLTAWLIRAGESVAGHGVFAMRLPFLLIGAAIPWQVWALARRLGSPGHAWQAATFALLLPLAGSLGVLALPDVPLTFAIVLATMGLAAALDEGRMRDWLLLGVALALCWLTHYRAAMPMLAGLVFLCITERGRAAWRRPGLWLALAVATIGLLPLIVFNVQQHGVGVGFQVVDRNPWRFQPGALVQPLEQAVACTPLMYGLLLWAMYQAWRRRKQAGWDAAAVIGGTFVVAYFVLGLFADDVRFRAHWPLPGYLVLCAALPALLASASVAWRRFAMVALLMSGVGLALGFGYLALAASPTGPAMLARYKAFPANFTGWRQSGSEAAALLARHPGAVLVADNFMLAAELRFQLGAQQVIYVLDSPLNTKHGRAAQLAIWQIDENALRVLAARQHVLLAVDETSLRNRERKPWLTSVCARVDGPVLLARVDLFGGRRRMAFYDGTVAPAVHDAPSPDDCLIWMNAWRAGEGVKEE